MEDRDCAASALALAAAAVALGYAVQVSNGNLHPTSVLWLTVALACCVIAVLIHPLQSTADVPLGSARLPLLKRAVAWLARLGSSPIVWVLGLGLAFQFAKLLTDPPAMYLQLTRAQDAVPFLSGLALAAVLGGAGLSGSPWLGRLRMPLLLATHFVLGVWLIRSSPSPSIDVFVFQRDSAVALLHGANPYSITFPDIYYSGSPFYGPGLSVHGRLTFGFPYPPLSLLLVLPGQLLGGDFRYAQLAAITASGALMTYARPGRLGAIAAAVFLFTPRIFFVLEQGWTEPLLVLLLAATVFAACRAPKLLPLALGLLFASKQYLVLAVPLVALLLPRPFRWAEYGRLIAKTGLVAMLVTLPFALWDLPGFIRSVIVLQALQPFRAEALSYLSWFAKGEWHPPNWLGFVAAGMGILIALLRAARTPAGFAASVALTFIGFFAFNKQAFCNYYFFVIGACCIAIAASSAGRQLPSPTQ